MNNSSGVGPPPGELVTVEGKQMHVRRFGRGGPRVVLETGLTMMSSCWGWLGPMLGESCQVIAYDRSGLGWSEAREGLRASEQIASELRELLRKIGAEQPFFYAAHSMGAMHARAFHKLFPAELSGMIFLDPAHPDQMKRVKRIRRGMRTYFLFLEGSALLAGKGLAGSWSDFPITAHLASLPKAERNRALGFYRNPGHLRASLREARAWELSAKFLEDAPVMDLPLLVISAQKNAMPRWDELQQELTGLSKRSRRVVFTDASHISLFAREEHAMRTVQEMLTFIS